MRSESWAAGCPRALAEAAFDAAAGLRGGRGERRGLRRYEAKCAMAQLLGYRPSKREVGRLLERAGVPPEGEIGRAAFADGMEASLRAQDRGEQIRRVFKAFDLTSAGFISRRDLHLVFARCAPAVPAATIDEVFAEVDADGDGRVSGPEFTAMMLFGGAPSFPPATRVVR